MQKFLNRLLNLDQYVNPINRRTARNTGIVAIVLGMFMLLFGINSFLVGDDLLSFFVAIEVVGLLVGITTILLVRSQLSTYAAYLFIGFFLIIGFALITTNDFIITDLTALWLAIFLAATLSGERTVLFTGAISTLIFFIGLERVGTAHPDTYSVLAGLWLATLFGWLISESLKGTVRSVSQEAHRRTQLLETSNVVTANISRRLELEDLLRETVEAIRRQFDEVYHAQVFLIDRTGRNAVLRASTGEVGVELLARKHTLQVGSQSVIGQVTQRGTYVLADDTTQDIVHRRNELLPNTRTELALPLRVSSGVIGSLDLQSLQARAFSRSDIEVFQALADQIALAIENARLLDNLQDQLSQNQGLLEREQANRAEIEQLNRELLGKGWVNYLQTAKPIMAQTIDIDTGEVEHMAELSPKSREVMQHGLVHLEQLPNKKVLTMPIMVENVSIGVMEFDIPNDEVISAGVLDSLNTLRDRLGILVENVRLFDQARTVASREQVVSEAAARLLQTRDFHQLLNQAAPLFNQIMGAQATRIRLGDAVRQPIDVHPTQPTNGKPNGAG